MTKIKFPKAPEIKVNWGDSNEEDFRDFKDWFEKMLARTANSIYESIKSLDYEVV